MRPGGIRALLAALAAAALAIGVAACGEEHKSTVVEGEPLELGELGFTVQLTRFLNPDDTEDAEYLRGLSDPPAGQEYLAVFMDVENEGDEPAQLPSYDEVVVEDTAGTKASPVESESLFALQLGETIEGGAELPESDSAAASGPVQGAFLLFQLPTAVTENRPLELKIDAKGTEGAVELDL